MRRSAILFVLVLSSLAAYAAPDDPTQAILWELSWRPIGPALVGGRIDDVAVVETNPAIVYLATATGGLFKTVNAGTTWTSVFDGQDTLSIGAVAVAPSNPEVVWVGTGEANNRQSSSWGSGVYRSTDGGATWAHVGLAESMHVGRIAVHPTNPDIAFVAAGGRLWGPNKERGLYGTTDGGKTWRALLQVDENTGCTDVAIDPHEPNILYAAMYQRRRAAYGFVGAGKGSGLYRSKDGGATWTKLAGGLPAGDIGRIGLSIYAKDPKVVYALVESASPGIYRSRDRGDTWTKMSGANPRPMYFSQVRVDPNDDQRLWVGGVSLTGSSDGGKTFGAEQTGRLHPDQHAIWIDPANSSHLLVGCDGGIQWSHDRGKTWDFVNTLPLAQFYQVAYDFRKPYWVAGGLQDNGAWIGPSATTTVRGPSNDEWLNVGGGDGFYCAIDPSDPMTVYSESQNGAIGRMNLATGERKSVRPRPEPGEPAYRFDWCTPFAISPHNPRKVLLGGNRLFVSTDRGDSWRRSADVTTSPDLTKLPIMGQMATSKSGGYPFQDIPSDYGQIVTLTESPVKQGVIYVGTDDGNLQVSLDDGRTFRNVVASVPGVPKGTYVSRVHASPHAAGRVYASFDGHRSNDFKPYVYVSDDFGETWRSIAANLAEGGTVNVIRDHPANPSLLFVGTDRGPWLSVDAGASWRRFPKMPNVRIDDIQVHPRDNDLILATHGRGIYILDDIGALSRLSGTPTSDPFVLVPPRVSRSIRPFAAKQGVGNRVFAAPNPPTGANIQYWVGDASLENASVKLSILGPDGRTVVREYSLVSTDQGFHRITWDLRWAMPGNKPAAAAPPPKPSAPRSSAPRTSAPARRPTLRTAYTGALRGPRVLPGDYLVRLKIGDHEQTVPIGVEEDPRLSMSASALRTYFAASMRTARALCDAQAAERAANALSTELTGLQAKDAFKKAPKPVQDEIVALAKRAAALQGTVGAPASARRPAGAGAPAARTESGEAPPPPAPSGRGGVGLAQRLTTLYVNIDAITEPLSPTVLRDVHTLAKQAAILLHEVRALVERAVPNANRALVGAHLEPLKVDQFGQDDGVAVQAAADDEDR